MNNVENPWLQEEQKKLIAEPSQHDESQELSPESALIIYNSCLLQTDQSDSAEHKEQLIAEMNLEPGQHSATAQMMLIFRQTGCLVAKAVFNTDKVDIVVINVPFIDLNFGAYVFWYESTHGKFNGTVKAETRKLVVNGQSISILQEADPANIKWGDGGTEYIVEAADVLTGLEESWDSFEDDYDQRDTEDPDSNVKVDNVDEEEEEKDEENKVEEEEELDDEEDEDVEGEEDKQMQSQ
ncbi:Glyceraldehyde-3-phosphate dehydrogenase [Galemys pyrenaicus]|uniref:Glyceraldehyde-3-phosphate dehydrogenase n=1 Tax=Galemys pyrenaicus TaxID=202257 RepID=A0A8J6B4Y9_GALPY|nr:Glyceraldehyde-3-phosphate dehydrogenase [Galemys pyrenaicus]